MKDLNALTVNGSEYFPAGAGGHCTDRGIPGGIPSPFLFPQKNAPF
jgi:hypothetical protein